jgi:hypothetical protein
VASLFSVPRHIIIFSPSFEQHLSDLQSVLLRIREAQLVINLKKCHFANEEIEYLGYIINSTGLKTHPSKVLAVQEFPTPSDQDTLQSFLGLVGYYRSFIKNFSILAAPAIQTFTQKR